MISAVVICLFYCVNKAVGHVKLSLILTQRTNKQKTKHLLLTHLFIHKDIDEGVDDSAALCQ